MSAVVYNNFFINMQIIVEIGVKIYYNTLILLKGIINMKKKSLIVIIVILAIIGIIIGFIAGSYNGLVEKREQVDNAQATISTQLQRRADLIPNFVSTVKGYSDYEQNTYLAVTEARSAVSGAKTANEQAKANEQLDSAISVWVNAITEAYPELKADKQYNALQDELSGTENRIARARTDYNSAAKSYNVSVKKFPKNIIAGIFGFEKVEYFESQDGAESVPQVSFD